MSQWTSGEEKFCAVSSMSYMRERQWNRRSEIAHAGGMLQMKVQVKYHCPSCDKYYVGDTFEPHYACDNCDTRWPKEDGRQCEQCHKFGRNTEEPVCECGSEVE